MIIYETTYAKLFWHNQEKTIFVVEIFASWTWNDAHHILKTADKIIEQEDHTVDIIYHFKTKRGATLPKGNIVHNVQSLTQIETANVSKIYYVSEHLALLGMVQSFIDIVNKILPIAQFDKFNFHKQFDDVITLLEQRNQSV